MMTDRGDKNIIFTRFSIFEIRSSGILSLFLNRPESPLENERRGIILSSGKKLSGSPSDGNFKEVVYWVPLHGWQAQGGSAGRPAGHLLSQRDLAVVSPIRLQMLEWLHTRELRVSFHEDLIVVSVHSCYTETIKSQDSSWSKSLHCRHDWHFYKRKTHKASWLEITIAEGW